MCARPSAALLIGLSSVAMCETLYTEVDLLAAAVLQEQVQLAHLQEGVAREVQNLIKAGK